MFAPISLHPAEVWRRCRSLAERDHPQGIAEPDPRRMRTWLPTVLGALVADQPRILLPGSPADAAALIGAVLERIPRPVAGSWVWSTCLLQVPRSQAVRVLAPGLPESLRHSIFRVAQQLDSLLAPPPTRERVVGALGSRARQDALDWLADTATFADLAERSRATTMSGLLSEIVRAVRQPTWTDVPSLLASAEGRAKLQDHPHLVTAWARADPADALRLLHDEPESWIRRDALRALVALSSTDHVWELPTAQAPLTEEHRRLGGLLREYEPDEALRADLMRGYHRRGQLADLVAARDWLVYEVGLVPQKAPDLFPARRDVIAAELGTGGVLTVTARDELSRANDPAQLLIELAPGFRQVTPGAAAKLIAVPAELRPDLIESNLRVTRRLARVLTRSARGTRSDMVGWVDEMLAELDALSAAPLVRRSAMYGALVLLISYGSRKALLANSGLRDRCFAIGTDDDVPEDVWSLLEDWLGSLAAPVPAEPAKKPTTRLREYLADLRSGRLPLGTPQIFLSVVLLVFLASVIILIVEVLA
jgi:hypothetical protein